jgi:arginine/lysine/ornithine decarboxylase
VIHPVGSARLRHCVDLLMTTSPNVLIYAALDEWCRQMEGANAKRARVTGPGLFVAVVMESA